jgi:hypothetical protein
MFGEDDDEVRGQACLLLCTSSLHAMSSMLDAVAVGLLGRHNSRVQRLPAACVLS